MARRARRESPRSRAAPPAADAPPPLDQTAAELQPFDPELLSTPGDDAGGLGGGEGEPGAPPGGETAAETETAAGGSPASGAGVVLYDPLRRYLSELQQFHPLSAEEEHELAVRFHEKGDVAAAYKLVTAHLRLVVRIAYEFKRSWLNLLDLIQEGNVGLLLAVRKFDPYRGIRLSTYASWWIRAYMIKFLLDNWRMVRIGTTNARRRLLFNLRREKEALQAQGITPLPRLLAERLDVSEADVVDVDRSLGVQDVSLEAPTSVDSDRRLADTLASGEVPVDAQVEAAERFAILNRKLSEFEATLDQRDRTLFRERLLSEEPRTLQELGDRFGLTREGLRQVEKRLLARLKQFLSTEIKDLAALDLVPRGRKPAPAKEKPRRKARDGAAPASPGRPAARSS